MRAAEAMSKVLNVLNLSTAGHMMLCQTQAETVRHPLDRQLVDLHSLEGALLGLANGLDGAYSN
jgi:hypothetical protein